MKVIVNEMFTIAHGKVGTLWDCLVHFGLM